MALEAHPADGSVPMGPIGVQTDSAEVAAFAQALRLDIPMGVVPLTFPIRWLALPPLRAATERMIGQYPVHKSQTFELASRLGTGCDYSLRAEFRQQDTPSRRLVIRSLVADSHGSAIVRFETVLLATATLSTTPTAIEYEVGRGSLPDIELGAVDMLQTSLYAAAAHDDSRLHHDPEFARSLGLEGPIIQGMLMMGMFEKALSKWRLGSQVSRLVSLFARPVAVGSRLVISGRIVGPANAQNAERKIIRLFVRTEDKQLGCIGEAVVLEAPASKLTSWPVAS